MSQYTKLIEDVSSKLYKSTHAQLDEQAWDCSYLIYNLIQDSYDIYQEKSAYSPFDYKWRQDIIVAQISSYQSLIHDIRTAMLERFDKDLNPTLTNELLCNDTSKSDYDKCVVCGADIISGVHQ